MNFLAFQFIYIYRIQEVKLAVRQYIFFRSADKPGSHQTRGKTVITAGDKTMINYHCASINAKSLMSANRELIGKDPGSATIVETLETTGNCSRQASFNTASNTVSISNTVISNTASNAADSLISSPTKAVLAGRLSSDK